METEREYLASRQCATLHTESVGDYILPDYNTDVKRVLLTRAVANDTGCFVNGDAIDVGGAVNYEIVYIDSEGELASCQFATDFDASAKCNGDAVEGCFAFTRVSGYSVRLVGPRKFSAKAQLLTDVNLTEKQKIGVSGGAFEIGEPQTRVKNTSVAYRSFATPSERSYSETLADLDGVIADDVAVLYTSVTPELVATAGDGTIDVGGMLNVDCFIKQGEEVPRCITLSVTVNESLVAEGMGDCLGCTPYVRISGARIRTEPCEDGVTLVVDFNAEYSAVAISNAVLPVVLDCYLTDREVENTYESFDCTEHLGTVKIDESLSFTPSFSELGTDSLREILLTDAYMRQDELLLTPNGAKMLGVLRFSGVACQINEEGELCYTALKYEAPFEINVNYSCHLPVNTQLEFNGNACSVSAVVTADGVEFNARVLGTLTALSKTTLTRLSVSNASSETVSRESSVITVYYPHEGETLFEVGRKFHTRPIDIAADNSLTEEVFSSEGSDLSGLGVKRLIIR